MQSHDILSLAWVDHSHAGALVSREHGDLYWRQVMWVSFLGMGSVMAVVGDGLLGPVLQCALLRV